MRGIIRFELLMVVLVALAGSALAVPACTNVTLVNQTVANGTIVNPIAPFTGSSSSCLFDGLDFSNFSVYANTGYPSPGSNLTVTLNFVGGNTLQFGTNMTQGAGEDIDLQYEITPGITQMMLTASGNVSSGVNEGVCSTQQTFGALTSSISFGVCNGVTLGSGSVAGGSSTSFAVEGSGTDWIFKNVNGVSGFSQTVVPEPMTSSLMGAGLLGLGFLRRYRKP